MGARQVRVQAAAIHGRRIALRGLAGRRQYRGGDRRLQRVSCPHRRRLGTAFGGADPLARAARPLRRERARARRIPLRNAHLPSAVFGLAAAAGRRPESPSRRRLKCTPLPKPVSFEIMHAVHIHQILNHYTSRQELDPGFKVLDNSANERPDWYEYWPIRRFLLNEALDEDAFYGFLSPKFKLKTSLSADVVRESVLAADSATDVILLSPSIHNSAYYLNVFEHGDAEHPGLKNVAGRLFERLDMQSDLDSLVSDSRNTVHSNYFIAKPRFWRAWLAVNEKMFAIAETPSDALGEARSEE